MEKVTMESNGDFAGIRRRGAATVPMGLANGLALQFQVEGPSESLA